MRLFSLTLTGLLTLGACKNENTFVPQEDPNDDAVGITVNGRVCDPDRGVWLEGAQVYTHLFDDNDVAYETLFTMTDAEGRWSLENVPTGNVHSVYIQYGTDIVELFDLDMRDLTLTQVDLDEPACGGDVDASVAVVTGDWDDFETMLEGLGFAGVEVVNGLYGDDIVQFLSDPAAMAEYDIVFVDGGHIEEDVLYDRDGSDVDGQVQAVRDGVKLFVNNGGSLYVTDWSYDLVEGIWPERVEWLGDDLTPDDAQEGEPAIVTALIADTDMAGSMGQTDVNIEYDLPTWPVIESVGDGVTVHLKGTVAWRDGMETTDVPGSPMLISFTEGQGTVVFSTFRHTANQEGRPRDVIKYMVGQL